MFYQGRAQPSGCKSSFFQGSPYICRGATPSTPPHLYQPRPGEPVSSCHTEKWNSLEMWDHALLNQKGHCPRINPLTSLQQQRRMLEPLKSWQLRLPILHTSWSWWLGHCPFLLGSSECLDLLYPSKPLQGGSFQSWWFNAGRSWTICTYFQRKEKKNLRKVRWLCQCPTAKSHESHYVSHIYLTLALFSMAYIASHMKNPIQCREKSAEYRYPTFSWYTQKSHHPSDDNWSPSTYSPSLVPS